MAYVCLDLFIWFYPAEPGEISGTLKKYLSFSTWGILSNDRIFGSTLEGIENTELKAILNKSAINYNLIPKVL